MSSAARISRLLRDHAEERPDHAAVLHESGTTGWRALAHRIDQIIETMPDPASTPRAVLLVGSSSPGFVAAFYAIVLSGRVAVPALSSTPEPELARMAHMVHADLVIVVDSGDAPAGRAFLDTMADRIDVDVRGHVTSTRRGDSLASSEEVIPPESVLVCFTSGSTGLPKAVVHGEDSLLLGAESYACDVLDGRCIPVMSTLPLSHAGAISVTLLACLVGGSPLVCMGPFTVDRFAAASKLAEDQVVMLIPTMVHMIAREARPFSSGDFAVVVLSGSAVESSVAERAEELFRAPVKVGMGMSECPGCFVLTPPGLPASHLHHALGRCSQGFETKWEPASDLHADDDQVGELLVRPSRAAIGYLQADGTMRRIPDAEGWIATGDLVANSSDGIYVLKGRRKEMYIRGGYNVFPAEVEVALSGFPGVSESAVHGVHDPVLGEKGQAWIVVDDPETFRIEELQRFLIDELARYKIPDRIDIIERLPKNAVGKVDKPALVSRFRARAHDMSGEPR
ncbi:N/A [soil metagenome]